MDDGCDLRRKKERWSQERFSRGTTDRDIKVEIEIEIQIQVEIQIVIEIQMVIEIEIESYKQ